MAADSVGWPDDETESETDDDSWFYASVKRYRNLHMFDLQQSTRVIEWIGNESICVAGFDNPERNEILELSVPERLLPSPSEDEGLCKDRDFKMLGGGFTNGKVWYLKHIPNSTKIVTSETGQNSIHIYKLGRDKSDVIEHLIEIKNLVTNQSETPVFDIDKCGQTAVFGTNFNDICTTDLDTGKECNKMNGTTEQMDISISQIHMLDKNIVLLCSKPTGQVYMMDAREPNIKASQSTVIETNSNDLTWTSAVAKSSWEYVSVDGSGDVPSDNGLSVIGCLSTMGNFIRFDIRNLKEPCAKAQLPHKMPKDGDESFLTMKFAPLNPGIISVSGYDGNVCVYDTCPWHSSEVVHGNVPCSAPLFIHDGHAIGKKGPPCPSMLVMSHCWHPLLPNVVLSAGADKSLHAWEWQVEPE